MSHRVLETDFPLMVPPNPPSLMGSISRENRQKTSALGDGSGPWVSTLPQSDLRARPCSFQHSLGRSSSLKRAYDQRKYTGNNKTDNDNIQQEKLLPCTDEYDTSTIDYHNGFLVQHRPTFLTIDRRRHHKADPVEEDGMGGGAKCCLGFLVLVAQILLHGVVGLVLYWVCEYHGKEGTKDPFAWNENPKRQFNLHPVLMTTGFIYFIGQAMLVYRSYRCCRRIWNKVMHTLLHLMAIPCIVVGFIAVFEYHELHKDKPIPHFYSIHSWMGLATMGLFALQFLVGFFSFFLLLCCEASTSSFRAALVPIHATFGITTFLLAIGTACTGLTEKAFFTLSFAYSRWVPYISDPMFDSSNALRNLTNLGPTYTHAMMVESVTLNVLAVSMALLGVVMAAIVFLPKFRARSSVTVLNVSMSSNDRYG